MKRVFFLLILAFTISCSSSDDSGNITSSADNVTIVDVRNLVSDLSYTDYRVELNGTEYVPRDQFDRSAETGIITPQLNVKVISTADDSLIYENDLTLELGKSYEYIISGTTVNTKELLVSNDYPARETNPKVRIINMLDSTIIDAYATPFNTDCSTLTGSEPKLISSLTDTSSSAFVEVDPNLNMLCITDEGQLTDVSSLAVASFGDSNAIWTYILFNDSSGFVNSVGYSDPTSN